MCAPYTYDLRQGTHIYAREKGRGTGTTILGVCRHIPVEIERAFSHAIEGSLVKKQGISPNIVAAPSFRKARSESASSKTP